MNLRKAMIVLGFADRIGEVFIRTLHSSSASPDSAIRILHESSLGHGKLEQGANRDKPNSRSSLV